MRYGIVHCNIRRKKLCSYTPDERIFLFVPRLSCITPFMYSPRNKKRLLMNSRNDQRLAAEAAEADEVGSDTSFTICPATFLPV